MKYFSVDFIPHKDDVSKKNVYLSLFAFDKSKLMQILMVVVFAVFSIIIGQYELSFYVVIALLIVPKIAEFIIYSGQIRTSENELMKRPVTVDFYDDHIVYNYNPSEKFKGTFEKHYGFDKVTNVVDYNNSIAFVFEGKDSFMIPKRAINAQQALMINNLIENLFKDKYIKANI